MCPLIVRLLLNMYTHQKLQVKWNNIKSDKFNVTNGVRQGGVLSPFLFSIYMDELLMSLKENGVGCHMNDYFVGAFGYADDIILLCPPYRACMKWFRSVKNMQRFIKSYSMERKVNTWFSVIISIILT